MKHSYTCVNKEKVKPGFEILQCPNMKPRDGNTSMAYEHYDCKICGKTDFLDYEEMK